MFDLIHSYAPLIHCLRCFTFHRVKKTYFIELVQNQFCTKSTTVWIMYLPHIPRNYVQFPRNYLSVPIKDKYCWEPVLFPLCSKAHKVYNSPTSVLQYYTVSRPVQVVIRPMSQFQNGLHTFLLWNEVNF